MKIFYTVKKIGAVLPAGTHYTFRQYYKADFNI